MEQAFGPANVHTVYVLNHLADLYVKGGRYVEAEPLYRRSLAILEARFGPEHAQIVAVREKYAALLLKIGRESKRRQEAERARASRAAEDPASAVR
jgi:hypothetical protein